MNLTVKVADWTIPMYGNKHCVPYGTLIVSDGKRTERCTTKGDKWDSFGPQYIVFNHRQYWVKYAKGHTMSNPKLELEPIRYYNPWQKKYQRNGYIIKWNDNNEKWQVIRRDLGKNVILEEFVKWTDAEDFCYEN